jgi:hypothetical protein
MIEYLVLGPLVSKGGGQYTGSQGMARARKEDLVAIKELLETGKVVPSSISATR